MRRLNDERGERRAKDVYVRFTRISRTAFKKLDGKATKRSRRDLYAKISSVLLRLIILAGVIGSAVLLVKA